MNTTSRLILTTLAATAGVALAGSADSDHMSFGVSVCTGPTTPPTEIIWVFTLEDGHIRRYDATHGPSTPAAKAAFRTWLEEGPMDVVSIDCQGKQTEM